MSEKNTIVGLLGGTLPENTSVNIIRYTPEQTVETVRLDLMDMLRTEKGVSHEEHLALVVDSPGGTIMQYFSWLMIMTDPNIKTKTAYVANHAESAAAMIAGSANTIVCLPTSRFLYHYSSAVNKQEQGSVTSPHEIVMGYHFTIESFIQFARLHLDDTGRRWLEEKILEAFYVNREAGIEDLKKIASGDPDWQTRTDSSIYKNDGKLEFTGGELAEKGAVELVDSVEKLEERYHADRAASGNATDAESAKVEELFQMSRIAERIRADGQECYVTLWKESYIFQTVTPEKKNNLDL